jgi:archaeal cell division control protein 6
MSMFTQMLRSGETLFRDTVVLDYDFQPKVMKFRETEQQRFALAIKPLLAGHTGRNLFVYGAPGIGKTSACRNVIRELEEETDEIIPIYINCWKENTTFKIYSKICESLGYKFLQNKKTSDLFDLIAKTLNKKAAVFIFDEIDKLEEMDFLYTILEDIHRKSIILITNYRDLYSEMDERIRSRLNPEFLNFRSYNEQEIGGILQQRCEYAFVSNCWDDEAFKEIIEKCCDVKDVRIGLYLMRESGNIAEEKSSRKVMLPHVASAIRKVDDFHIKSKDTLDADALEILELVKKHSGKKIGDVYTTYSNKNGKMSYRSFQRRIVKLREGRFISTEKITGKEGHSTVLFYASDKKLTEY